MCAEVERPEGVLAPARLAQDLRLPGWRAGALYALVTALALGPFAIAKDDAYPAEVRVVIAIAVAAAIAGWTAFGVWLLRLARFEVPILERRPSWRLIRVRLIAAIVLAALILVAVVALSALAYGPVGRSRYAFILLHLSDLFVMPPWTRAMNAMILVWLTEWLLRPVLAAAPVAIVSLLSPSPRARVIAGLVASGLLYAGLGGWIGSSRDAGFFVPYPPTMLFLGSVGAVFGVATGIVSLRYGVEAAFLGAALAIFGYYLVYPQAVFPWLLRMTL